ncbi:MAG TPA: potassium-transporting ATPase subunit KdpA [Pseudobacteroides sp.]|uniref:potassium-transporting ATPase subunit KdpA n=1 Tax=Pseudobacteroides sp. TaxID=1968840 RepID=UPI002F94F216
MGILQISITVIILVVLSIPLGKYIYKIISGDKSFIDPVFNKVDGVIYKLTGIRKDHEMNWKEYIVAILLSNIVLCFILFLVLKLQGIIFLNPNKINGMESSLALNTAISFITNTNLQDYSGESGVSYFTQMMLTCFMFVAPATGLAATAAFLRGITGRKEGLGNFYVDLTRFTTRLLLPISIAISLFLVWQGVPQTLSPNQTVSTIEGKMQDIALGPVAALEAIKNLASNGGGFFGANSAHPFENPTPLTNLITIICLGLIATSLVFAFGNMIKNKKQSVIIFLSMFVLLIGSIAFTYYAESKGNPILEKAGLSQSMGNMEGKETRFGVAESSLFVAATTAYQVGAVNAMHDSLTPLGGLAAMWNMMLQTVFGGKGTGFIYIIMYAILTVFLCGLMVGRTPEFLGRKIEGREIKMVAIAILLHPLLILLPTAIALLVTPGTNGITNPGFHGFSQILYQFTSSAANNGSGFEGLADNTVFWNISAALVMLIGRYIPLTAMLALAGSMASKRAVPVTAGTFKTDKAIFGVMLVAIVIIVGALTFLPSLVLGPIAEHLTMMK